MNEIKAMNEGRRAFLARLGQAIGGASAAYLASAGLSQAIAYQIRADSASRPGIIFSQPQMATLHDICASIIPRTDTKSAAEVDCHGFVDHQLSECHSKDEQQSCRQIIDHIDQMAKQNHGKAFVDLEHKQQSALLRNLEALKGADQSQKAAFSMLKALIVFGYFTSQEGASVALDYQAFPGGFKGSVPVTTTTKVHGSLNYY